jgi:hypothetical protein
MPSPASGLRRQHPRTRPQPVVSALVVVANWATEAGWDASVHDRRREGHAGVGQDKTDGLRGGPAGRSGQRQRHARRPLGAAGGRRRRGPGPRTAPAGAPGPAGRRALGGRPGHLVEGPHRRLAQPPGRPAPRARRHAVAPDGADRGAHRRGHAAAHARPGTLAPSHLAARADRRRARRREGPRPASRRGHQDAQPVPRLRHLQGPAGRQPAAGHPLRRQAGHRQDPHGQGDGPPCRGAVPVRLGDQLPVDVVRHDRPQDPGLLQGAAQAARQEGGAIGFIEEIDAIGGRRGGLEGGGDGPVSSGTGGVVNELLVQLQSFDTPPFGERLAGRPPPSSPSARPATTTSWSSRPPTGATTSTRPCCAPAASTAGSTSTCPTPPAGAG